MFSVSDKTQLFSMSNTLILSIHPHLQPFVVGGSSYKQLKQKKGI